MKELDRSVVSAIYQLFNIRFKYRKKFERAERHLLNAANDRLSDPMIASGH